MVELVDPLQRRVLEVVAPAPASLQAAFERLSRRSGLWNNRHVDESYDPSFLDVLEERVEEIRPP